MLPLPHEGHATRAKPADMSGRAAEDRAKLAHCFLAEDMEQLQQQMIPHEWPRLVLEAINSKGEPGVKKHFCIEDNQGPSSHSGLGS